VRARDFEQSGSRRIEWLILGLGMMSSRRKPSQGNEDFVRWSIMFISIGYVQFNQIGLRGFSQ
jgi:hypothetical protein